MKNDPYLESVLRFTKGGGTPLLLHVPSWDAAELNMDTGTVHDIQ